MTEETPPGGQSDFFDIKSFSGWRFHMGLDRLKIITTLNDTNKDFINHDLYRLLYNKQLYVIAYENIKGNKGALTPGADLDESLQGFSEKRIDKLILQMRSQSWQPKLARQILIPKPGKTTLRPLGIQGPEDKIVQEVVRMILNAIYNNNRFDTNSYGFRPNLGCHDALKHIKENFDGLTYCIEGDIQAFFPSVCHQTLIKLLRKKIQDQRFLDIIFKMLRAGYWSQNDGTIEKPDVGTPQGSIVSPILSNIYLNELDGWIRKWTNDNIKTSHKLIQSSASKLLRSQVERLESKQILNPTREIGEMIRKAKLDKLKIDPYDDSIRKQRLVYVRYADDFIIGLFGHKDLAIRLKQDITEFLEAELKLTLSQEKTKITDLRTEKAIFLGHEIYISSSVKTTIIRQHGKTPFHRRTTGKFVKVEIPTDRVIQKLYLKGFCTQTGYPISAGRLTVYDDEDIVKYFNTVLIGYLNYYSGTTKTNAKSRIRYIMRFSCAKTLAHKHKSSMAKMFVKYGPFLTIKQELPPDGKSKKLKFKIISMRPSKVLEKPRFQTGQNFKDPFKIYLGKYTRSKLFSPCSICGSVDNIEMHHLNSLKNIRPKTFDQLHGYLKRKQIPLCAKHHRDVTYGRYDGFPLDELLKRTQYSP